MPNLQLVNNFGKPVKLFVPANKGLEKRFGIESKSLSDRLAYELNVIESINAAKYFLLLRDIVKHADSLGFCHFCSGTANASLVCYCLGLTDIDPIEHDLLFESFIIPGQKQLPDINLEFDATEKLQAAKAVKENFGLLKSGSIPLFVSGRKNLKIHMAEIKRIQKTSETRINFWKLPLDDKVTWAYFHEGLKKAGAFLLSQKARKPATKYRPVCFDDLLALLSLQHLKAEDSIDHYFRLKTKPGKISFPHPALQPVVESTMGMFMFQEQILRTLQLIGGFTLEEAGEVRGAMENRNRKVIERRKTEFVANALRRGLANREAQTIYSELARIAPDLLFKSAAAAEAYLFYQASYIQAHHPK